jgi:hypothetical protein
VKKLNYLLHSVTVVDFVLVAKLAARYRAVTALGLLALAAVVPYLYLSQPVVYQKEVFFKIVREVPVGADAKLPLSNLGGPSSTVSETVTLVNSYEFVGKLAAQLARASTFLDLDFDHPTLGFSSATRALARCADEACRVERLRPLLPHLYALSGDAATDRFGLKLTTRSAATTMHLLQAFERVISEQRIAIARELAEKQIAQLQELTAKSRRELEAKGGFEKLASAEFLDALIGQQKDKILGLSNRLARGDSQVYSQWVRLRESDLAASTSIAGARKLSYESYVKLSKRVEELRQNVAAITATPAAARTETDAVILAKLQAELAANEAELAKIGNVSRNLRLDDSFIDTQKGNKSAMEFDYRVTGAQVRKLRAQYEQAKEELDELFSRKAVLENELIVLKPDLEYLKLLESKLVALRFRLSSIGSDVHFEAYGPGVTAFKRSSLTWIALFSAVLVGFLLFICYIGFYLFDDRIFDELEIERCVDELPIVGHAPHFE